MKNWLVVLGVLGVGGMAHGDIKYATETTIAGAPAGTPKTVTLRAVKPNFERSETTQKFGPMETKTVSLRECGKKQTIQLAPDLKIYAVIPDYGSEGDAGGGTGSTPGANKPTTGKMVMTYAVKDLGEETILNFKTRHYMIETEMVSSGCAGNGTTKLKQEIWVSDVRDANPCPNENSITSMSQAMSRRDCKIEVETKGDFEKYTEIYKGLVLRQIMYNGDAPFMTIEVTMLSQAKLGDELFTIPADFKKVSPEEFQKAQSEAMVKAMQAGIRIEPNDD
jgi:hypothetical protein